MQITIVDADLDDPRHQAAIVDLIDRYARDPMGGGQPLPDAVRRRLVPGLRAHPTALVVLAFAGETAVGVAVCFRGFSTFTALPLLNIHDLAVVPEFRRHGIGRSLLHHVEQRARALGCGKLTLEVRADNRVAQRLYYDAGFAPQRHVDGRVQVWFLDKPLVRDDSAQS